METWKEKFRQATQCKTMWFQIHRLVKKRYPSCGVEQNKRRQVMGAGSQSCAVHVERGESAKGENKTDLRGTILCNPSPQQV